MESNRSIIFGKKKHVKKKIAIVKYLIYFLMQQTSLNSELLPKRIQVSKYFMITRLLSLKTKDKKILHVDIP
jgi:hypothetical protein